MTDGGSSFGLHGLLGLGIDAVDIQRFAEVLDRRPTMAERLFTPGERAYAADLVNPTPSLAARFAVKEAVMKALGAGLGAFAWGDVEVTRLPSGAPEVHLRGQAATLASARGITSWLVSITHTASVASAVVAGVR